MFYRRISCKLHTGAALTARVLKLASFALTAILIASSVHAAAGDLDQSFGTGGKVLVQPPLALNTIVTGYRGSVLQSDNKIVSLAGAGDAGNTFRNVIFRFNPDGGLDYSFGNGGFVYVGWNSSGSATSIAIQQVAGEERFVIAGSSPCGQSSCLRVERYASSGTLDTSFGTNGVTSIATSYPIAVAVQSSDQKILMVGSDSILVRLNANGTPDNTFGLNGISQARPAVKAQALAIQSNGRIIVSGSTVKGKSDIAVVRFNTNGTLDDGTRTDSTPGDFFGAAGIGTADFAKKNDNGYGVAIDGSGRIIVAGRTEITGIGPQDGDAALVRFTSAGKLDATFGNGGKTSLNIAGGNDQFYSVALQANGKIVVFGESLIYSGNTDMSVARYNINGTLDTAFGTNAWVTTDIFGSIEGLEKGLIQIDPNCNCEKIVVFGTAYTGGSTDPKYTVGLRYLS
jgi:uncharacterized delta-60 repeat protein